MLNRLPLCRPLAVLLLLAFAPCDVVYGLEHTCDADKPCSTVPVPAACTADIVQNINWGVSTAAYQVNLHSMAFGRTYGY